MLSDLQLVYMGPRNSTQLLKINTTKFQVEREPVYNLPIVKRGKESKLGTVGVPITRWNYITKVYDCD